MNFKYVRTINNNAVIAYRDDGEEMILLGRGIGVYSGIKKDSVIPNSYIERRFILDKGGNKNYLESLLKDVPYELVKIVISIIHVAGKDLNFDFQDNFFLTILDHLMSANERYKQDIAIENPLLNEIKQFHKKEFAAALKSIEFVNNQLNTNFDENEAGFIAFHYMSAISEEKLEENKKMYRIIRDVRKIVEKSTGLELDPESIYYFRFTTHLKLFINRVSKQKEESQLNTLNIIEAIKQNHTREWNIALLIRNYFINNHDIQTSDEELGYLVINLIPLLNKLKEEI